MNEDMIRLLNFYHNIIFKTEIFKTDFNKEE